MGKRKDMRSILSGIVGSDHEPEQEPLQMEEAHLPTEPEVSSEMVENLNALRKKNVGRPHLREQRERENRATFIIPKDTVTKLKYISLLDGRLLKDVASEAFEEYIERWEKKRKTSISKDIDK